MDCLWGNSYGLSESLNLEKQTVGWGGGGGGGGGWGGGGQSRA